MHKSIRPGIAAGLAALLIALPAAAQTNGGPALLPPDQLFAPPASVPPPAAAPGKFQALYNEASLCSGLSARLRGSAGMFAARALTESTRAQRSGHDQMATDLRTLFTNATVIRDTAGSAHETLESYRNELAQLDSVNDTAGNILLIAGGRSVMPLPLDTLPAGGQPLLDAMMAHTDTLLESLDGVSACMTAVGNVEITGP